MKSVFIVLCLCIYAILLVHYAGMCLQFFSLYDESNATLYLKVVELKLLCSFQLLYAIVLQSVPHVITARLERTGQMAPGA